MNKQHLIDEIAANGGISKREAATALDVVLDTLIRRVVAGDCVAVTGFGTLQAVTAPAHYARNPQTGDRMLVPARKRVKFSPGAAFTEMLRGKRPVPPAGQSSAYKLPKVTAAG